MSLTSGRAVVIATILLLAVALAAANVCGDVLYAQMMADPSFTLTGAYASGRLAAAFARTYALHVEFFWFFAAAPLAVGVLIALLVGLRRPGPVTQGAIETAPAPETPVSSTAALRLLALLQREGRLIDFIEEDIEAYSDAQVGAAVRTIHAGCRNALHEHMHIERIFAQEDGTAMEIEAGFDPSLVRLTGNVHGNPPFRGTLQHGGWRATEVTLSETSELDPTILAAAEVEIP